MLVLQGELSVMGVVNRDLTLSFDSFDKYSFEMMHNLEKASDKFEIESQ